jgi:predicted amidohydrolase YtcJ
LKSRDRIFVNGKIYQTPFVPPVDAIRIRKGKILCLGSFSDVLCCPGNSEIVDLEGATVLPGFIDSHNHMMTYGLMKKQFNCRALEDRNSPLLERKLREYAFSCKGNSWVLGYNFNESHANEFPDKSFLDSIIPDRPVLLVRSCTHSALLNSEALKVLFPNALFENPKNGRMGRWSSGEPDGWLYEEALEEALVRVHSMDSAGVFRALKSAQEDYLALGLTGVHDPGTDMISKKDYMEYYLDFEKKGLLKIRTYLMSRISSSAPITTWLYEVKRLEDEKTERGSLLRLGGVKLFADGSIGSRTAALSDPYEGSAENRGLLKNMDELKGQMEKIHKARMQIVVHAIGDLAVSEITRCFGEILEAYPFRDHRHRIEHAEMCDVQVIREMKRLGLLVTVQPSFIHDFGDDYRKGLGPQRAARLIRCRDFLEECLPFSIGTDAPISSPSPWENIWAAMVRKTKGGIPLGLDQSISLAHVLDAYTAQAAFAGFHENECGSLSPGKEADMAIFEENPFLLSPEELPGLRVKYTVLSGNVVYAKDS